MSVPELKRCFECGASHPPEVLLCPNDGTPLCFDTVGRRWKVEGLIGRRPGGAVFSAFHLVNGTRAVIDVLPGENARDATALTRFQQQLQALRMLDLNKGILKLIEEGTEHDGSRFIVTDLGRLRQLTEVLAERRPEWQRPGGAQLEPTEAAHLVRPLLSVLSTAGRLGMAHGSLDMSQIYIGSETDFRSLGALSHVKLHGIVAMGMGQQLREAQTADLRAVARVLYELCTGRPLPEGDPPVIEPLPESLSGAVGQVVLRAIGLSGSNLFATAEEMQRALSTAAPSGFTAPISVPPGMMPASARRPSVPPQPSKPAVQTRSLPPPPSAPSLPSLGELGSSPVGTTLPPVRLTTSQPAVPAPLMPVAGLPQRSGLTSELHQVSILDLMREMKDQKETVAREETLARSRFRPSSGEIKTIPREPPGGLTALAEPGAGAAEGLGNEGPTVVDRPPSGVSLEPTLDAHELPLRPDSANSARVTVGGQSFFDPAAPSSLSGGTAGPSAASSRGAIEISPRSAASSRLAAAAGQAEILSPSAASSPRPSAVSASRAAPPSASSSPLPSASSASRALPSTVSSPRPSAVSGIPAPSSTSGSLAMPPSASSSPRPPVVVIPSGASLPRAGGISEMEDAPTAPAAPAVKLPPVKFAAAPPAAPAAVPAVPAAPDAAAPPAVVVAPEKPDAPALSATGLAPVPRWAWFAIIGPLVAIILGLVLKIVLSK